jgi:hypothetical protein
MVKDLDYTMKALKEKNERGLELVPAKSWTSYSCPEDTEWGDHNDALPGSALPEDAIRGNNLSVVHTKLTHVICKRRYQPLDSARRDFKRDEVGEQS